MTDILPWLISNWLLIAQIFIALVVLILLIIGVSFAVSYYFWRWVIQIERESMPLPDHAFGDNPYLPPDYWEAVAREEAKRDAA